MTTESTPSATAGDAPTAARMVIGGESIEAADGQTFEVVNPATGRVIATAPQGGKEDVDRAVAAARAAFADPRGWATWAAGKRGRTLAKLAALIKAHTDELAWLESRNVGKPISGSRGEVTGASLVFDYYAGAANKIFGQTIPVSKPGLDLTLREPIGVVGLIVDSIVFLWLAFGSLEFLAGQVVGKGWMVLLSLPFILYLRRRDAQIGLGPA